MSEREQIPAPGTDDWRQQTTPGMQPVRGQWTDGAPGGSGQVPGPPPPGHGAPSTPERSTPPRRVRRPDGVASLLLLLAGRAAGVSLLLRWLPGSDRTGYGLVRRGLDDFAEGGAAELVGNGFWQPLAVTLGGAALFLLGLLVVLPARSHRFLGGLALGIARVAGAGVLVPLGAVGWDPDTIDTGFWFAVAVPVLGLLGAFKALFTRR